MPAYESLLPMLDGRVSVLRERPSLLFTNEELKDARTRAEENSSFPDAVLEAAERALADPDLLSVSEPYYSLGKLEYLVSGQLLRPDSRFEEGILNLLRAFCEAERWVAHVHGNMKCDHASANTAAAMAIALDALGDSLSPQDEQEITEGIYERCLRLFLQACEGRSEFWAQRDHPFNWRIMTCGEAGLAALGLGEMPERQRIIEFALEGVCDILDRLPPEGDFEEGPSYWSGTLLLGLRFGLALRRATDGRADLFQHPGMKATTEFFTHVTLPDGSVFNFGDNSTRMGPTALHLLARETGETHLARTARKMGLESIWDYLFDDPSLSSEIPPDFPTARVFPTTGIAVARTDWSDDAAFLGFKSGPVNVGHSHLDIQSFVISKGSTPLITDPGIWPYAHFLGFFDRAGPRWDFDGNATIAHNTVLVGGRGQEFGKDAAGRIIASSADERLAVFVSEAASLYPDRLEKFERWIVFAPPDIFLIYDDLKAVAPQHWEWLLHHAGNFTSGKSSHLIENEEVRLSLVRLLPPEETPWRNTEEVRTSFYEDSNALAQVERTIGLRRFGPMFPSEEIEFLWAIHLGDPDGIQWEVARESAAKFTVRAKGERTLNFTFDRSAHSCQ